MATVRNVELNIRFDEFDISTGLRYRQRCVLSGVDDASEDGTAVLRTFFPDVVSAGGAALLHRSEVFNLPRSVLNEDLPPGQNPDELRMRCEIDPLLPRLQSATSDVVEVNLS
jgi:hypothetical protein